MTGYYKQGYPDATADYLISLAQALYARDLISIDRMEELITSALHKRPMAVTYSAINPSTWDAHRFVHEMKEVNP